MGTCCAHEKINGLPAPCGSRPVTAVRHPHSTRTGFPSVGTPHKVSTGDHTPLCRLACAGLPAEQRLRAQTWQLLLGYLPPRRAEWEETLQKRRQEYNSFCDDFNLRPDRVVRPRHAPALPHNEKICPLKPDCHFVRGHY